MWMSTTTAPFTSPKTCEENATVKNTRVTYMYRDENNYKRDGYAVFAGEITDEERETIRARLDTNNRFLPVEVGLAPLEWSELDGNPWHELTDIESCGTKPTEQGDVHAFAARFAAIRYDTDDTEHQISRDVRLYLDADGNGGWTLASVTFDGCPLDSDNRASVETCEHDTARAVKACGQAVIEVSKLDSPNWAELTLLLVRGAVGDDGTQYTQLSPASKTLLRQARDLLVRATVTDERKELKT
jgi:hypothetical protein